MARFEAEGIEALTEQLGALDRDVIKSIVMAGADAAAKQMTSDTQEYRHVVTGEMAKSAGPGEYHEGLGEAWVNVYPQGTDRRGVSNAVKAYVINYGIGKRPRTKRSRGKVKNRTGDKFITGNERRMEEVVSAAMQAESDRQIAEINGR